MFERYTDRARRVITLSQDEARGLNHHYIGTEHLLLGLLHEGEGIGAQALQACSVDLDDVRARVVDIIGTGPNRPTGHIPFTPRAKKVLELSLREALQLGHNYIGTEHILLGLIREGEGVGMQILVGLGVDLIQLRDSVLEAAIAAGVAAVQSTATVLYEPPINLTYCRTCFALIHPSYGEAHRAAMHPSVRGRHTA